jgi:hypothetical protein
MTEFRDFCLALRDKSESVSDDFKQGPEGEVCGGLEVDIYENKVKKSEKWKRGRM